MITNNEKKLKGEKVEEKFRLWLDKNNISYFYISQEQKYFSRVMKETLSGKRPDFLVLIQTSDLFSLMLKVEK